MPEARVISTHDIQTLILAEHPYRRIPIGRKGSIADRGDSKHERYSRQILAFGPHGQDQMAAAKVAVIGAGGIGSMVVHGLARLGFQNITVVDPDCAETSNLNRVQGMTHADAALGMRKVDIACRSILEINPTANPQSIAYSVFDPNLLPFLKSSDLLVVATDNHATRMYVQRIGVQYLIPVLSIGVNIEVDEGGKVLDVSGEYALALPGQSGWCLSCAHAYSAEMAAVEMADAAEQDRWTSRGYISGADVPAPAVVHLNGVIAHLALAEIHNLFAPYKDLQAYVSYDQLKSELMPYTVERNKECALCSPSALLGVGDLEPIPDYLKAQRERISVPAPPAQTWDAEEDEPGDAANDGSASVEKPGESEPSDKSPEGES